MARLDGGVTFESGDQRRTLRYGVNALCDLEDRLGVNVSQFGEMMGKGLSMKQLRTVFACGLPDSMTDAQAGEIIDAIGVPRAGELVGQAMQAAFPSEAGAANDDPRPAAAGTGSTS